MISLIIIFIFCIVLIIYKTRNLKDKIDSKPIKTEIYSSSCTIDKIRTTWWTSYISIVGVSDYVLYDDDSLEIEFNGKYIYNTSDKNSIFYDKSLVAEIPASLNIKINDIKVSDVKKLDWLVEDKVYYYIVEENMFNSICDNINLKIEELLEKSRKTNLLKSIEGWKNDN